ncbi:MAG: hypothetical protein WCL70_08030 [Paludibacter sp.]
MKNLIFFVLCSFLFVLSSCKPTQLIVHDIEYRDKLKHDSIYVEKNKVITITRNGDTVFVDRLNTEYKYKYLHLTDSVYKYVEKPVFVQKLVYKEVERKFTWWESILLIIGKISLYVIIIVIIYAIVKFRINLKDYCLNLLRFKK